MAETAPPQSRRWRNGLAYAATALAAAAVTFLLTALLLNIRERKDEAREHYLKLANLDEDTIDPEIWGRNFPRQYDGYKRTVDVERTRHGGSEAFSRLEADPRLKRIFAGYAFSIDYREERGHAYMLRDQDETERVHNVPQPGACIHCHASALSAFRRAGDGDVTKGFERVCALARTEARKLVDHPIACIDCHDPRTLQLRVT